jgi:hypothetical protein
MLYNALYNSNTSSLILLPVIESVSDIAFEKGWRIIHPNLAYQDVEQYKERFGCEVYDGARFYLDHLVDDELDDQDVEYLNSLLDPLWDTAVVAADLDEEEFDENFSSFPEEDETEEE